MIRNFEKYGCAIRNPDYLLVVLQDKRKICIGYRSLKFVLSKREGAMSIGYGNFITLSDNDDLVLRINEDDHNYMILHSALMSKAKKMIVLRSVQQAQPNTLHRFMVEEEDHEMD